MHRVHSSNTICDGPLLLLGQCEAEQEREQEKRETFEYTDKKIKSTNPHPYYTEIYF